MSDISSTVRPTDVGPQQRRLRNDINAASNRDGLDAVSPLLLDLFERAFDAVTTALVIAFAFHLGNLNFPSTRVLDVSVESGFSKTILLLLVSSVYTFFLGSCGMYSLSGGLLRVRETACLLRAAFLPGIFLSVGFWLLHQRKAAIVTSCGAVLLFLALLLQKHLFRVWLEYFRIGYRWQRRVLIYGIPDCTRKLSSAIQRSTRSGMRISALIDSSFANESEVTNDMSVPMIRAHEIDTILVAQPNLPASTVLKLRALATDAQVAIYFLAVLPGDGRGETDHLELDGQHLYGSHKVQGQRLLAATSRALDLAAGIFLLGLFGLPMVVAAALIRLTSPGPILFQQTRIGRHGKPFTMLKFRTMHQALCRDSASPVSSSDPRITPIGRLLRKTSLDEMPQLFNVIRGDMAMVGPRPEMPFIVADYKDVHRQRLAVKPGLTGLWQISKHRAQPIHENIEYDLYYLKHRCLSVDLAVLLHTMVFAVHGI